MRDFIIGVTAGVLANHLGHYAGRRMYNQKTTPKDPATCSCSHEYSMHNDNGNCNVVTQKYLQYKWHKFHCPCLRYDGIPPAHVFMKD